MPTESVGELRPDDELFSSKASGKLVTEPERDVETFVYKSYVVVCDDIQMYIGVVVLFWFVFQLVKWQLWKIKRKNQTLVSRRNMYQHAMCS